MRHIHQYILVVLLSFSILPVKGQKLDSLLKVLHSYKKEDAKKLSLLNAVSQEYQFTNITSALQVADTAIELGKKINDPAGLAQAYMIKAQGLNDYGNRTESLALLQLSLDRFQELNDKSKMASCLKIIGDVYLKLREYNTALTYYNRSLALSEQLGNKSSMATAYTSSGMAYHHLGNGTKALEVYEKAITLLKETGGNIPGLAAAIQGVGRVYSVMDDFPKALTYFQKSLELAEKSGATNRLPTLFGDLATIYDNLGNAEKALDYRVKILEIARKLGTKDSSLTLSLMGAEYAQLKQLDKAERYYLQSIRTKEQSGGQPDAFILMKLGYLYYDQSEFGKAWAILNKALPIAKKQQNKGNVGLIQMALGKWYAYAPDSMLLNVGTNPVNRYNTASTYLNDGKKLVDEVGNNIHQRYAWGELSTFYEHNHEYAKALDAYKEYINLRDSIANNQNDKKVTRIVMQYEFDKKSDSMKLVEQLTAQKLEKQVLLATQQQQEILLGQNKLELSNKELQLTNKEKDLQHLAFLSTQSSLENEQLEKQGKVKQLELSENEKQLQAAQVKSLKQEKKLNELKRRQQFIYFLIGIGLLGFTLLYFFYRARLQSIRLKNEIATEKLLQQQQESKFQKQLGDISLTALRSQMNPHFIFNCLNSIKLYTEQNNTAAASEYLTKFSTLIRQVLDGARAEKVLLSTELNTLALYMDMEGMRFKNKLRYYINIDKQVDADFVTIPTMLLQPYVENAIWHGLMQKKEGGNIDISVGMDQAESFLIINIADNGIGRQKAEALKSKTATKHKSYGMKVTSERLALLNTKYKLPADVTITDLFDKGEPAGTLVTLKIPIE